MSDLALTLISSPSVTLLVRTFCSSGLLPFSLETTKDGEKKIKTCPKQYVKFALVTAGLLSLLSAVVLVHLFTGDGANEYFNVFIRAGMKDTDYYSVLASSAVAFAANVYYWAALCVTARRIDSNNNSNNNKHMLGTDGDTGRGTLIFCFFLTMLFVLKIIVFITAVVLADFFPSSIIATIAYVIFSPLLWLSPSIIAGQSILHFQFKFHTSRLEELRLELSHTKENFGEKEMINSVDAERIARQGLEILRDIHTFTTDFGQLILSDVSCCFVVGTFSYYFLSNTLDLVLDFNTDFAVILATAYALTFSLEVRRISLFRQGQALTSAMDSARQELVETRIYHGGLESDLVTLLEKRLATDRSVVPCGVFRLDHQTLAGGYGLLLTYSIVLVQLKMGERS